MTQFTATPSTKSNPLPKLMAQPTAKPLTKSKFKETKKVDLPKRGSQKVKNTAPHARRSLTRAVVTETFERPSAKWKELKTVFMTLSSEEESSDSHDNYDSVEDESYRHADDEVSSEKEEVIVKRSIGKKNDKKLRTSTDKKQVKEKRANMVEDDGLVCVDSRSEDDELFFGPIPEVGEMEPYYDAQDGAYDEYDGGESCHSEEMKTPPNSVDELEEVDSD
ncbi:hypothetical protein Ahy_B08g090293 [Arachis hypogaea]|uniref:Uncharacterized protein n=1 Tax=Arachis hypogaea TaxID=3818 RepID=A0A444XZY4_ARAHY|nr:hypothetical protein Ahy_B08g090293 [Arachis hypogaea]